MLGDEQYGRAAAATMATTAPAGRLSLHCTELTVMHPLTGQPLALEAPVPPELAALANA